ncbi:MAG: MBL fold metallo-hydrolase [Balneolaceae bacterium]
MKRADFIKQLSLVAAGSAALPYLPRLQDTPFELLRDNVGIFSLRGGTIGWLAASDATVVVDSQYEESVGQFLEGVTAYNGGPETMLINSHHHGDHVSGNAAFQRAGYRIIAHENVPALQRRGAENPDAVAAASETYRDEMSIPAGDETVELAYYGNAHTAGDSVTWFLNANIAHMGDLVFNRLYPFIDRNGGASIQGWISLLETVASEADTETLFIFGHGNPQYGVTGTREDLLYKRDFLSHLLSYTQRRIQAGASREEIIQTQSFDEFPDVISPSDFLSLPRNLDVAYRELTES